MPPRIPRPFKIFNYLDSHEQFLEIVAAYWAKPSKQVAVQKVWCKLKQVKMGMQTLANTKYAGEENKIELARRTLKEVQSHMRRPDNNATLV